MALTFFPGLGCCVFSPFSVAQVGVPVRVLEASKDGLRQGEGAAIGLWQVRLHSYQKLFQLKGHG